MLPRRTNANTREPGARLDVRIKSNGDRGKTQVVDVCSVVGIFGDEVNIAFEKIGYYPRLKPCGFDNDGIGVIGIIGGQNRLVETGFE